MMNRLCRALVMAACLIASVPTGVVYNIFLDRFIAGFTFGSVK